MKNVYKLMLLVAVMMLSVTANAHKKSIHKIAPQLTTCQRMMMKKAKPAKNKKAIARNFFQMNNRNGGLIKKAAAPKNATIDIVATNLSTADYSMWFEEYGYYMWASTDAYEVSLWVNTTKFAGKYTTSDVDTDYSYIADAENAYAITSINITCSESNGAQTITGTAVCEDGNTYKLNLTYVKPTKTSEETITISDGLLYDETSSEEYFEAAGMNASNTRYVQVCVYSDKVAGTYTTDDCDTYYTFIAKVGNRDTTYYDLVDADLKVTMVDETTAKITGTLLCQSETDPNDVPEFTISMTCEVEGGGSDEGLDYDAMSDDFNATFTADDDVLVDDSYFNAYNVLYIDATTADGKKSIGLEFNVSEKDNQIVIPEGVYQITSGYGEGTVTASEGVDEEGYITYSFAGTLDEDGAFEDPMWFMVGGTVTVTNDNGKLKVVVDAVNSYGCEVTSTITTGTSVTPDPTPGENLVQNGSFEEWTSDSQPTGWEGWQITEYGNSGGAVLSRTTDHHEGSYACLVAGDAKSNKRLSTGKMTLKAGKYYVQFYAKAVSGEGAIKPGYATKQANGDAAYTYIYGDDCIALSSSWKKISYDFTLKANTDIAMVVMNYKNSGDCIIDDYKLWAEGSKPDTIPTPISDDIYTIDFTQSMDPWTIDDKKLSEGLSYVWKQDSKYGMKAGAYVNKTCLPSESWLISPEIDLANRVSARMIINHAVNNCATPTKYLSVKVSTDNKTWDNVEVSPWPAGNSWDYNNAEGSLDKYVGKKIHVAFVYTSDSNYAPTWEIKTFEVIGEAAQYGLPGDADGDGVVTVSDITAIAAYILGNTPANFNAANADVDGDGQITVSDITATAAIILGTK